MLTKLYSQKIMINLNFIKIDVLAILAFRFSILKVE